MRGGSGSSARTRTRISVPGAAVAGFATIVLASACSSAGGTAKAAGHPSTTVSAATGGAQSGETAAGSGAGTTSIDPTATGGDATRVGIRDPAIPLTASVTGNSGLHDGDEVSIHVEPKDGSLVYGFEAIVCAGSALIVDDADIRPTYTGKCITNPLSPTSQKYMAVKADPPYKVADAKFRVGVGTNSYTTRDGNPVAITCGPGNPCELVLKLQYPNGFGFASYPLTFG